MRHAILIAVLLFGSSLATAGSGLMGGAFATVTYTRPDGMQWIDSGIVRRVYNQPSPVKGYSIETVEFTDHSDGFHLDEGTVEILWR